MAMVNYLASFVRNPVVFDKSEKEDAADIQRGGGGSGVANEDSVRSAAVTSDGHKNETTPQPKPPEEGIAMNRACPFDT